MIAKDFERYQLLALMAIVGAFLFFVFRPFLVVLILAASVSLLFAPLYKLLLEKVTRGVSWLAALLTVLVFIVVVVGPLVGVVALIVNQVSDLSLVTAQVEGGGGVTSFIARAGAVVDSYLPQGFSIHASEKVGELIGFISGSAEKILTTTLNTVLSFLLLILALFYLLKDSVAFKRSLVELSPLTDQDTHKIFNAVRRAINGVIKGYPLVGLAQGTLMGIGLAVFGVPHAVLWAVLTAIVSMVPTIGTALVAIPACLYLVATGHNAQALGFGIWALVLVGTIDNVLNPYLVGSKIDIPPLFILFSVLGGVALLGPVGILIGPVSISLMMSLHSVYMHPTASA
jgi:predicted PurR-regulated permease PerM